MSVAGDASVTSEGDQCHFQVLFSTLGNISPWVIRGHFLVQNAQDRARI